ncbi:P-loop containing nucleoside triphosphate hydrolase protein [Sparassis latifolia]
MGPTGSGKSSFINMVTGRKDGVGHALESFTTEIGMVKYHIPERSSLDVVFVDTPGFDDTYKSDLEILQMIADWLKKTYEKNIKLSGIVYLHRISDNRMAGTPLKNLRMFEELCGKSALQNIILATTMWDEVDETTGLARENELKKRYWKGMMNAGSRVVRFKNSRESAWCILDDFLENANERYAMLLQRELVDMGKQLPETRAGQQLYHRLADLVKKQQNLLRQIQRGMVDEEVDEDLLSELKKNFDDSQKELLQTIADVGALRISLGKRLLHFVSLRWRQS